MARIYGLAFPFHRQNFYYFGEKMKQVAAAFAVLLMVFSLSAAIAPLAGASSFHHRHGHCRPHGYRHAECHRAVEGKYVAFHIPGYKHNQLEIYFKSRRERAIDIEVEAVACPTGTPAHAVCFGIDFFDAASGKPIEFLKPPLTFKGTFIGALYQYSTRQGKFVQLHGKTGHSGVFYLLP